MRDCVTGGDMTSPSSLCSTEEDVTTVFYMENTNIRNWSYISLLFDLKLVNDCGSIKHFAKFFQESSVAAQLTVCYLQFSEREVAVTTRFSRQRKIYFLLATH